MGNTPGRCAGRAAEAEDEAIFSAHMAVCPACTALFEEARRGREWLEFLSPEPEVPAGLLDRILAQTGPGQVAGYGLVAAAAAFFPCPGADSGLAATRHDGPHPAFCRAPPDDDRRDAFFSIALTLNLTGVRLSSLRCRI